DGRLEQALPVVEEQQQRARHQRQHDRDDDEMGGGEVHRSGSLPSTWSVPLKPRAARRTTRNSAVVANPMTMAVSTSACGSGSAKAAGSISPAPCITGGALTVRRPIEKMNRLTA